MSNPTDSKARAGAQAPGRIDADASAAFLGFLGDALGVFAFQIYDDDKARNDKGRAKTHIGTFDECRRALVTANRDRCAVHVTINDTAGKRRIADNVVRVRKHFVEIDGTHTLEEIKSIAADNYLDIAWINESSPGKFHVYFNVADDVGADLQGFTYRQKQLAALFDGGRESVDLSRVLRLPGFYHRKGEPFMVRTVYKDETAHAHTISDFDMALPRIPDVVVESGDAVAHEEDQAAIDRAIEHFKMFPEGISDTPNGKMDKKGNNQTYDAIAAAKDFGLDEQTNLELALEHYNPRCKPEWSFEELQTIVRNAYAYTKEPQGSKHPLVMAQKEFESDPPEEPTGEVAANVAAGEREQAAEREAGNETWKSIKAGWVYVGQQKQFVRRSDGKMWDADGFEKQFGYVRLDLKDGSGNRPKSFTKFLFDLRPPAGLQTFDSFAFVPGQPVSYKGDFNQWRPSGIEPREGDTAIWDAHLAYLFADEAARNRVLNWMAWVYQNPTLSPNHSILVHGKIQGTGKTVLPRALAKLIGANPATPLSQHMLELDHNAWVLRTKLAIVDIRSSNKKLSDMLHDLITGELVHVDLKGAHDFDITNVIAYWLETNKADALAGLDNSDRRHEVETTDGESPLQPQSQDYYDKLYPAILDDPVALAAIAYALKTRDLKGYSGLHRAPSTQAKRAMMTAAADEVEKWMLEHRDEAPLCRSVVMINEVLASMPTDVQHVRVNNKGARSRIPEVLTEHFNGENLGQVWINKRYGQPRLWAINKTGPTRSIRKTFEDKQIAQMFLNERWEPTQADIEAMASGLEEATREFGADPIK